jgi:hypothetical protein
LPSAANGSVGVTSNITSPAWTAAIGHAPSRREVPHEPRICRLIEALRPFIPRTATAPPFDGVAISSLTDELCACEELQTRKAEDFPES